MRFRALLSLASMQMRIPQPTHHCSESCYRDKDIFSHTVWLKTSLPLFEGERTHKIKPSLSMFYITHIWHSKNFQGSKVRFVFEGKNKGET